MKKVSFIGMAAAMLLAVGCGSGNNNSKGVDEALANITDAAQNVAENVSDAVENAGETIRDLALEALDDIKGEAEANATEKLAETLGVADAVPFVSVEEKPTFEGGDANNFAQWINSHLVYPQEAIDKGLQGRVAIGFVVNEEGDVTNVKVLKGVNELLDKAAVETITKSPKWEPGKQNGNVAKVAYVMPVIFKLK